MEVSEDDLDGFAGVADDVDAGAGGWMPAIWSASVNCLQHP